MLKVTLDITAKSFKEARLIIKRSKGYEWVEAH